MSKFDGTTAALVEPDGAGGHKPASSLYGKLATAGDTPLQLVTLADGLAAVAALFGADAGLLWNGATFDLQRANSEVTLLASAARTAATPTADQINPGAHGVLIFLNITAASGTGGLTVQIQAKDPVSGGYSTLNGTMTAILATGLKVIAFYPGASSAGNVYQASALVLPRTWRVNIAVGDGSSYTYSVAAAVLI